MDFVGRDVEVAFLERALLKPPVFGLIRGRRRVGKTTLAVEVLKRVGGVYLFIDSKKNEKTLLEEFERVLRLEFKLAEYVKVASWSDLFEIILAHNKLVVFDEFQRVLEVNPSSVMQLQKTWDLKKSTSKAKIFLTGSNVGLLKKIFIEAKAPLFKRLDFDMALKPFTFSQVSTVLSSLGIRDFEEQIRIYSIFGGIPNYYALVEKSSAKTWLDIVNFAVLNPFSPLKDEVRETMIESFGKDHFNYYSVISAIAIGKNTKKEIADYTGILETSIYPYLYDLRELVNVIEYQLPVTEEKDFSKKGRFVLKDNFFKFWFSFIFRNSSAFEQQNYDYVREVIKRDFDSFIGFAFEEVSLEFIKKLNSSGKLPEKFSKIGKWWNRKGDEIDIVLTSKTSAMLVECKWGKSINGYEELKKLKEKEKLMNCSFKNVHFALVARGFAKKTPEGKCFDLNDVFLELTTP